MLTALQGYPMVAQSGVDEVMALTSIADQEARLRSYALLAEVFDLSEEKS